MEEGYADWANLPRNFLHSVLDKLFPLCEYARFGSVCKPWLRVAYENYQQFRRTYGNYDQLPMLMLPAEDSNDSRRSLYNFITGKVCSDFQLSVPYSLRATGSSNGWIATWGKDEVITICNPILGTTVRLPPLVVQSADPKVDYSVRRWSYYPYCVDKVVVSGDNSWGADYVVAAIYAKNKEEDNVLAYIKSGDENWTCVDHMRGEVDVIFYKGHVLAVDFDGEIIYVNVSGKSTRICPEPKILWDSMCLDGRPYIVESSSGDLLFISRIHGREHYEDMTKCPKRTRYFVLRLIKNPIAQPEYDGISFPDELWECGYSLGDDAVFIGDNHSMCVKASEVPGCEPNCIYYTEDDTSSMLGLDPRPLDMGIYHLKDESITRHYKIFPLRNDMPYPFWVFLTLPKFQHKIDA